MATQKEQLRFPRLSKGHQKWYIFSRFLKLCCRKAIAVIHTGMHINDAGGIPKFPLFSSEQ